MFDYDKSGIKGKGRAMEVLVVGNTAYVDDDFCAKAFPGDHVQVVAADDAQRDGSSPHGSWKELLRHLDQAYEFDRVVYLSTYLTPHTETFGDIELLRSVFRACMGRRVQLLYVAGPAGAEGAGGAASNADSLDATDVAAKRARALSPARPTTSVAITPLKTTSRPRFYARPICIPPPWRSTTPSWYRCSKPVRPDRSHSKVPRTRRFPCCALRS